ncbi:hypothetical protein F4808DRAFT_432748 [Astrocystis sublimbata]|nr:hypothetical protein F4808DRAFT_432748 [Astrocystis sublimbata]
MDDPWGSPWASNDAPSDNDPRPPSTTNFFLSPPPKAFFGNGSSSPSLSPRRGDDDSFNVWSTTDRADPTDGQSDWGAWAEAGIPRPPRLSPRLTPSGKDSPLAWPESAAASPAFFGNSRSRTPSILRHSSPDPWATELSTTNRSNLDLSNTTKAGAGEALKIAAGPVDQVSHAAREVTGLGLREDAEYNDKQPQAEDKHDLQGRNSKARPEPVHRGSSSISKGENPVYESTSRTSSTCTADSRDIVERPESPLTSIDEDRRGTRQQVARKTSGKVQELVGRYDGLARAASEEPPVLGRRATSVAASRNRSSEQSESASDDDDAGFGDFEGASTDAGKALVSPAQTFPPVSPSTPKAAADSITVRKVRHTEEEEDTPVVETTYDPPLKPPSEFGDLNFIPNIANLDKLFSNLSDFPANGSAADRELWDDRNGDSFTTISERKSWYRISRLGSMRMHSSGGYESYHRVTWRTSQLHDDTIKIARRWMEQDSYAGKATLGGAKRTGFFDWDSDAAPVALDEVFKRRESASNHARTTSTPAVNFALKSPTVVERPYRNSTDVSIPANAERPSSFHSIPPFPSFGWGSEAPSDPSSQHISPVSKAATQPEKRATHRPEPVQIPTDEEEDDWGEMVFSPPLPETTSEQTFSAVPPPQTNTATHESTPRNSLAISNVHSSPDIKSPIQAVTQTASSDPWSFSDFSVLDNQEQPANPPKASAFSIEEKAIAPGERTNTKLPEQDHAEAPSTKALPANIPSRATAEISGQVSQPMTNPQDDIIIQNILHNLPDLSYMLR